MAGRRSLCDPTAPRGTLVAHALGDNNYKLVKKLFCGPSRVHYSVFLSVPSSPALPLPLFPFMSFLYPLFLFPLLSLPPLPSCPLLPVLISYTSFLLSPSISLSLPFSDLRRASMLLGSHVAQVLTVCGCSCLRLLHSVPGARKVQPDT